MIWTLFKPSIFFAPFSSSYTAHRPARAQWSPRALVRLDCGGWSLRAERRRAKTDVVALCRFGGDRLFGFFVAFRLTGRWLDRHPKRRHPCLKHIQAGLQFGIV